MLLQFVKMRILSVRVLKCISPANNLYEMVFMSRAENGELMQPDLLTKGSQACMVTWEVGCLPHSQETENCVSRSSSLSLVTETPDLLSDEKGHVQPLLPRHCFHKRSVLSNWQWVSLNDNFRSGPSCCPTYTKWTWILWAWELYHVGATQLYLVEFLSQGICASHTSWESSFFMFSYNFQ